MLSDSVKCNGPETYLDRVDDFLNLYRNLSDNWDHQIRCVVDGIKAVAMTDYNELLEDSAEELADYYQDDPKDLELRNSPGLNILTDNSGTRFWFRSDNKRNAELLIDHYNRTNTFPEHISEIIRSLLLGYTESSIILYLVYNDVYIPNYSNQEFDQDIYNQSLEDTEAHIYPLILEAKNWIESNI